MRYARHIIAKVPGSPRLWLMLFAAWLLAYSFFEIVDDVFFDPLEGDMEASEFDAAVSHFFAQAGSERLVLPVVLKPRSGATGPR
ncbi:MAG: hypothetical protein RLZZ227_3154 [Pseudomonadota bacterium]|jgi:hypothetical protein